MKKPVLSILSIFTLLIAANFTQAFQYPSETGFSETPVIELDELRSSEDSILILDVRSKPEFDTAHIKEAVHCKISDRSFLKTAQDLLASSGKSEVVTYCNGPSCLKAPASANKLIAAGIKARALYDGVPGWADTYPERTVLRGKPISADNQLIPKADFKAKCLAFEDFKTKAAEPNAMVIDIRDNIQASGKLPLGETKVLTIPLDKFIPNFVASKKNQDKTLLIFDQVGKQVQALEYDLKENGYTNYFFLSKGATKTLGKQTYKK